MPQADSRNTTILSRRAHRAGGIFLAQPQPVGHGLSHTDLGAFPDEYVMRVVGSCMEPALPDKCRAIFSKVAECNPGDLAAIWLRPEVVAIGGPQATVKCLLSTPDDRIVFPYRDRPDSNVLALLVVGSLNPEERFVIRYSDILAIHRLVAMVNGHVRGHQAGEIASSIGEA